MPCPPPGSSHLSAIFASTFTYIDNPGGRRKRKKTYRRERRRPFRKLHTQSPDSPDWTNSSLALLTIPPIIITRSSSHRPVQSRPGQQSGGTDRGQSADFSWRRTAAHHLPYRTQISSISFSSVSTGRFRQEKKKETHHRKRDSLCITQL